MQKYYSLNPDQHVILLNNKVFCVASCFARLPATGLQAAIQGGPWPWDASLQWVRQRGGLPLLLHGPAAQTTQTGLHQVYGERPSRSGLQCSAIPSAYGYDETHRHGPPLHHLLLPVRWHHPGVWTTRQELRYVPSGQEGHTRGRQGVSLVTPGDLESVCFGSHLGRQGLWWVIPGETVVRGGSHQGRQWLWWVTPGRQWLWWVTHTLFYMSYIKYINTYEIHCDIWNSM